METHENPYEFTNGHFEWNHIYNELQFISHEIVTEQSAIINKVNPESEMMKGKYEIEFKDDIDLIDKLRFRKKFRRQVHLDEPAVILLQDVKDVTIFTANPKNLTSEFVVFLHTPMVDRFFRSLIIYFQFYFQTWEKLKTRREELETKITQPIVVVLENAVRDNLSELRSIFAREYFSLLIGSGDAGKYHHSQNTMSMSERDRRLCEMLIQFSTRMVWYALHKPPLGMIAQEVDRLARSTYFNKYEHRHSLQSKAVTKFSDNEKRILRGITDFEQTRLNSLTPVGRELIFGVHDHRTLAIGQVDFPPSDDRLRFLEKLFLLPEEELGANEMCLGILGMPRDNFDVMLKQKRKKTHGEEEPTKDLVFFCDIPSSIEYSFDAVPNKYPITSPTIRVKERKKLLKQQRNRWLDRLLWNQRDSRCEQSREYTLSSCASILL